MIAVLPILLYPLAGVGLVELAAGFSQKPQVVGIYGVQNLMDAHTGVPPVLEEDARGEVQVASQYLDFPDDPARLRRQRQLLQIRPLGADVPEAPGPDDFAAYRKPLDDHAVDLVVIVPPDFARCFS